MHIISACGMVILAASAAFAENTIILYRDGTVIRQEATAVKGIANIPVASGMLENTLTVIPAKGTTILGVETLRTESGNSTTKEVYALTEQLHRLEDRLQALETREAIFTSAAKSQSGKTPRKTKTNSNPMQTIRQGTDFAIAQLEAVYTARRRTTQEINKIKARLAAAGNDNSRVDESIRINVTPHRGRVTVQYATDKRGWQPRYNMNASGGGSAVLQLYAHTIGSMKGYRTSVSPASLAESSSAETFSCQPDTVLASYVLPVTSEQTATGVFNKYYGVVTNSSRHYLPAGDSGLFYRGTYLGKFRFEGLSSGSSRAVSYGR